MSEWTPSLKCLGFSALQTIPGPGQPGHTDPCIHSFICVLVFISSPLPLPLVFPHSFIDSFISLFLCWFSLAWCLGPLVSNSIDCAIIHSSSLGPLSTWFLPQLASDFFICLLFVSLAHLFFGSRTCSFIHHFVRSFIHHFVLGSLIHSVVDAVVRAFIPHSTVNDWFIHVLRVSIWCDCSPATLLAYSRHFSKRGLGVYLFLKANFLL